MEEVSAQQSIIHQTSQALELIAATEEYHGTKEEIEAERLLVVASKSFIFYSTLIMNVPPFCHLYYSRCSRVLVVNKISRSE